MGQIQVEKKAGGIEGLCVITPTVHGDSRGYFMETYNQKDMEEAGLTMQFVQDNQSASSKGVLRGLHFQKQYPQGKLVRVIKGCVFDVAAEFAYKCTDFYHPNDEGGLAWNDPEIGIVWPKLTGSYNGTPSGDGYSLDDGTKLLLSDKDQLWKGLKDTFHFA